MGVELRILSKKQTPNFKAKMVHGNIKRGILDIHVNIRSLCSKMSEVKNLIVKEKPHIHGISEAELRKACHKKSLQFEQKPALQDPQSIWIRAGFKNMKKKFFSHQYREHTSTLGSSIASQRKLLEKLLSQWEAAIGYDNTDDFNEVHVVGDMNLDSLNNGWLESPW